MPYDDKKSMQHLLNACKRLKNLPEISGYTLKDGLLCLRWFNMDGDHDLQMLVTSIRMFDYLPEYVPPKGRETVRGQTYQKPWGHFECLLGNGELFVWKVTESVGMALRNDLKGLIPDACVLRTSFKWEAHQKKLRASMPVYHSLKSFELTDLDLGMEVNGSPNGPAGFRVVAFSLEKVEMSISEYDEYCCKLFSKDGQIAIFLMEEDLWESLKEEIVSRLKSKAYCFDFYVV